MDEQVKELKELNKNFLNESKKSKDFNEKLFRELEGINKTFNSIRTFIIAQAQLTKSLLLESQKNGRDIQTIKLLMEEKDD